MHEMHTEGRAVARFRAAALQAQANKACPVCQGRKLDRDDAVRGRLGVIQTAEPTVFRYCRARGMSKPPAVPAKKLQPVESLQFLSRRACLCRGDLGGIWIAHNTYSHRF